MVRVADLEEMRNAYRTLFGEKLFGTPQRKWKDNIKMNVKEIV
jgi:hypothetical protein